MENDNVSSLTKSPGNNRQPQQPAQIASTSRRRNDNGALLGNISAEPFSDIGTEEEDIGNSNSTDGVRARRREETKEEESASSHEHQLYEELKEEMYDWIHSVLSQTKERLDQLSARIVVLEEKEKCREPKRRKPSSSAAIMDSSYLHSRDDEMKPLHFINSGGRYRGAASTTATVDSFGPRGGSAVAAAAAAAEPGGRNQSQNARKDGDDLANAEPIPVAIVTAGRHDQNRRETNQEEKSDNNRHDMDDMLWAPQERNNGDTFRSADGRMMEKSYADPKATKERQEKRKDPSNHRSAQQCLWALAHAPEGSTMQLMLQCYCRRCRRQPSLGDGERLAKKISASADNNRISVKTVPTRSSLSPRSDGVIQHEAENPSDSPRGGEEHLIEVQSKKAAVGSSEDEATNSDATPCRGSTFSVPRANPAKSNITNAGGDQHQTEKHKAQTMEELLSSDGSSPALANRSAKPGSTTFTTAPALHEAEDQDESSAEPNQRSCVSPLPEGDKNSDNCNDDYDDDSSSDGGLLLYCDDDPHDDLGNDLYASQHHHIPCDRDHNASGLNSAKATMIPAGPHNTDDMKRYYGDKVPRDQRKLEAALSLLR